MRILELDLDRYGPVTGMRLVFRPDARVHIVFSADGAGGSWAPAAIADLLFGIEHPGDELRIGATICDRAGAEFSFRRRKDEPTLVDLRGSALPDDVLAPFLGTITREIFLRTFGLDPEKLRKGGDILACSGGDLSAALRIAAAAASRRRNARRAAARMTGAAAAQRGHGWQNPLIARAGELFSLLTGGAFRGLGQTAGGEDAARLVGRRAVGRSVPVESMSEETRDLLSLALRLAYVEDYAATAEPAPILGDHPFLMFDDRHLPHGLRALAAIGGTVQPIVFTRRPVVVETALSELGDAVDVLDV